MSGKCLSGKSEAKVDEDEDDATLKYRERMQRMIQDDEKRRSAEESRKQKDEMRRDEELQQQKKAWHLEQQRTKDLEKELHAEKMKN